MGVQWTKEQQEVIRLRDRNILVSAAAGSGKTAVLVERILSKITDKEHPVDIDRLLIMTFTRAAAGEMKERISAAIEKALCEDPDNEHLQRQTTLLHTAQITTIDGFCAYIIRNYFHLIGLDPGYRTADEGELKLLRGDVVKALLEEYYARKDEKFQKFVECFATGKSDENLGNLIQKLYEMAMSNPFPQEWLSGCMDDYRIDSLEELRETEWMKMLWDAVKDELQEAKLLVVMKSRAVCPHIQPVGISEIFEAGTRLSIFSFRLKEVLSRSIVTPFLICTTLPKMSPDNHSSVSLARAEPLTTLPTVVMIFCIPTFP